MTSIRSLLASSSKLLIRSNKPLILSTSSTSKSFSSTSIQLLPSTVLPPTLPLHATSASRSPTPFPQTSTSPTPLELLSSQPNHYISVLFLGRRYLLTQDDILTVPKLKNLPLGTKISLTRILEVGSRDFTLRASSPVSTDTLPSLTSLLTLSTTSINPTIPRDFQRFPNSLPYLSSATVSASATIIEHTKGKMFEVEKFKKRKGYRRLLRFKLGFTKLRIGRIIIGDGIEVVGESNGIIKDDDVVVETV